MVEPREESLGGTMRITMTPAIAALLAAAAALIGPAAPAHADDDADIKFLQDLQGAGITATNGDGSVLIKAGHQVCAKRLSGETEREAINDVMTGSNVDNFTGYQVVAAAELNYCPQYFAAYHPGQQ
jgi:Protein of unknown function (DUF732)